MAKCKHCGADIWWATHATTGKTAPLDAAPDNDKGNCLTMNVDDRLVYTIPPKAELPDLRAAGRLRTSHWMTCRRRPAKKGAA